MLLNVFTPLNFHKIYQSLKLKENQLINLIIIYIYLYYIKYFMIAPYLPSIFVPIIGIFMPAIAMIALFIYIENSSN
jgi:photosystem I reaction center subunit VIII